MEKLKERRDWFPGISIFKKDLRMLTPLLQARNPIWPELERYSFPETGEVKGYPTKSLANACQNSWRGE